MLTQQEVADQLGIHINSVRRLRHNDPTFPRPIKITSNILRWEDDALARWLAARRDDGQDTTRNNGKGAAERLGL